MPKPIILVKIGGSLITDKEKPFSLNKKGLDFVCQEIKKITGLKKHLILGHGAGSFAHFPARKYRTSQGIINKKSVQGISLVAQAAAQLNRIVVDRLLSYKIKAISLSPLSMMTAKSYRLKSLFSEPLEKSLLLGLTPVLYGDVVFDEKKGCTIFSTEKVLNSLAFALKKKGFFIEKLIYCTLSRGVYDQKGETIFHLNNKNFKKYKKAFGKSKGIDITGGMAHKIEEILISARKGIPGFIIDGKEKNNLSKAILEKKFVGTKIDWIK